MHLVVEVPQPLAELCSYPRVERAERLVEEQDLRLGCESSGERHPLSLPAGELGRVAVSERLELDEAKEHVDPFADLRLRPLAHPEPEGDVVAHGHVLERCVVLEHEADVPLLRRERGGVAARERDRPGVGPFEPGDDAEEGGLARAARPEESGQRPALDLERDVVERDEVAEALRDVGDLDRHYADSSLGLITIMATSTRTAVAARTSEIAYAPARSKLS